MRRVAAIFGVMGLAACDPLVATAPDSPELPSDACRASSRQSLVGQPEAALAAAEFAGPVRIIRPGMALTMDFSPTRLNFQLDAKGMISRVYCG